MEHVLERSLVVSAPIDDVFGFFGDAGNLERITPPELRFRIVTPLPIEMRVGAEIRYQLSLFGIPFGWTTEITCWDPGRRFVDEQRRGPYSLWRHTHSFEAVSGGTRIDDEVRYRLPLSPLGDIVHPIIRRELDHIFDFRTETCRELFRQQAVA